MVGNTAGVMLLMALFGVTFSLQGCGSADHHPQPVDEKEDMDEENEDNQKQRKKKKNKKTANNEQKKEEDDDADEAGSGGDQSKLSQVVATKLVIDCGNFEKGKSCGGTSSQEKDFSTIKFELDTIPSAASCRTFCAGIGKLGCCQVYERWQVGGGKCQFFEAADGQSVNLKDDAPSAVEGKRGTNGVALGFFAASCNVATTTTTTTTKWSFQSFHTNEKDAQAALVASLDPGKKSDSSFVSVSAAGEVEAVDFETEEKISLVSVVSAPGEVEAVVSEAKPSIKSRSARMSRAGTPQDVSAMKV